MACHSRRNFQFRAVPYVSLVGHQSGKKLLDAQKSRKIYTTRQPGETDRTGSENFDLEFDAGTDRSSSHLRNAER